MQPKYASAFAQKGTKNLMDASLAYLSGPDAFFPIRIEKSPRMKGRYILIKLTMGMLNTSMIGKRYTQGKLHPKWLMTQILMDRKRRGVWREIWRRVAIRRNASCLRSGGRCIFSHTFQRNPLTGDWFDAIIFPVVTECTRDFHGPLAQLVRASGS